MLVLIVDNDEDDVEIFQEALFAINPNIKVVTANDGLDAFKIIQSLLPKLPDFIFLDLNMPRMNGKEFLYLAKKEISLHNIPIVIYSTTRNVSEIKECFKLGAAHFLVKPADFNEIIRDIKTVLYPKVSQ
jgi:CheY-like chemotaxis protein